VHEDDLVIKKFAFPDKMSYLDPHKPREK